MEDFCVLLTDFYKMFPEYQKNQFNFKFQRNEIYIIINLSLQTYLIIDYFNNKKIKLILKDNHYRVTSKIGKKLAPYHIFADEDNYPACFTNLQNLTSDVKTMQNIISKIY